MKKLYINIQTNAVDDLLPVKRTQIEWGSITDDELIKELEYFGATNETIGQNLINVIIRVVRSDNKTCEAVVVALPNGNRLDVSVIERELK